MSIIYLYSLKRLAGSLCTLVLHSDNIDLSSKLKAPASVPVL